MNNQLFVSSLVLLSYSACVSAFFLNWGAPEPMPMKPQPVVTPAQWPVTAYYQQRYVQQGENGIPIQIPAIPIQVPLQAQLSQAAAIQNVQLVPCMCPVSQDFEYDKINQNEGNSNSVFLTQMKPQQN